MYCETDQQMHHFDTSVSENIDLNNGLSWNIFLGVSSTVIYKTSAIPENN